MPELLLTGCAPVPLAHYLKALGIFRLVAEQKDPNATGRWRGDHFELRSKLDLEDLFQYFLQEYQPTPIIVPWSGGDFFGVNQGKPLNEFAKTPTSSLVIEALLSTNSPRFEQYRRTLQIVFCAMNEAGVKTKKDIEGSGRDQRSLKSELLQKLRSSLPDLAVAWLDAAAVIEPEAPAFNVLLGGGGGSDGNSHFSDNFMQCLWMVLPDFQAQRKKAKRVIAEKADVPENLQRIVKWKNATKTATGNWEVSMLNGLPTEVASMAEQLGLALYPDEVQAGVRNDFINACIGADTAEPWSLEAIGGNVFDPFAALKNSIMGTQGKGTSIAGLSPVLFDSTRVGGANQTAGFEAKAGSNPWDYILMLEGAVLFAGAIGRKLDDNREPTARFPFLFRSSSVGLGSTIPGESAGRELWLPIWNESTSLSEVRSLLSEGRVEKHGRMAKRGTDAFIAAAQLGFDRGVKSFQRIGFFKGRIGGDNYFTTVNQGRIKTRRNPRVDLLRDIEKWNDELRRHSAKPEAPNSVVIALTALERSIMDLCQDGSNARMSALLAALGRTQRAVARSFKWASDVKVNIKPACGLRPQWLLDANDGSVEFRLAASLAGVRALLGKDVLHMREHLEPVVVKGGKDRSWVEWAERPSNDVVWHNGDPIKALNAVFARRVMRTQQAGVTGWQDWCAIPARLEDITAFIEGRTDDALLLDLLWGLSLLDWQQIDQQQQEADGDERAVPSALYALLKLCFHPARKDEDAIPLVPDIARRAMQGDGVGASTVAARRLRASGLAPLVTELPVSNASVRRTTAALLFPISSRDRWLLQRTIIHEPTNLEHA